MRGAWSDGVVLASVTQEVWIDDPHARGRAFLKRYNRALDRLESFDIAPCSVSVIETGRDWAQLRLLNSLGALA